MFKFIALLIALCSFRKRLLWLLLCISSVNEFFVVDDEKNISWWIDQVKLWVFRFAVNFEFVFKFLGWKRCSLSCSMMLWVYFLRFSSSLYLDLFCFDLCVFRHCLCLGFCVLFIIICAVIGLYQNQCYTFTQHVGFVASLPKIPIFLLFLLFLVFLFQ